MLTRESALARLRATGTLSAAGLPRTAITAAQAKDPLARLVAVIAAKAPTTTGPRHLAPSRNQGVLP